MVVNWYDQSEARMIERHITFNVHPDKTADFVRFFTDEYRPAMARSRGFVRADLLRETENRARYQLSFRFEDLDASAEWRTSEVHEALKPALSALHGGQEIEAYEVVA